MEESQQHDLNTMTLEKDDPLESTSPQISVSEFSCHCCYDILINPTTLNCGHSFCRHCLALWWTSSKKTECPECREKWEGFPKVNILLRYAQSMLVAHTACSIRFLLMGQPCLKNTDTQSWPPLWSFWICWNVNQGAQGPENPNSLPYRWLWFVYIYYK